jgi:hypothetical protein
VEETSWFYVTEKMFKKIVIQYRLERFSFIEVRFYSVSALRESAFYSITSLEAWQFHTAKDISVI